MSVSVEQIQALSDDELRDQLVRYGVNVGPIGETTRKLYENKLMKVSANIATPDVINETHSFRANTPLEVPSTPNHQENGASRQSTPQPAEQNGVHQTRAKSPLSLSNGFSLLNGSGDRNYVVEKEIVITRETTIIENTVEAEDEQELEDLEEIEEHQESFRQLSPSEFASRFRSFDLDGNKRSDSARSLRDYTSSPITAPSLFHAKSNTSSFSLLPSSSAGSCVLATALLVLVIGALIVICHVNLNQLNHEITETKPERGHNEF